MPRITTDDVRAWVESTKLNVQALNIQHLAQIETEILSRIGTVYDTAPWTNETTTPDLIKVIIAKSYAGWLYDKFYSENQSEPNQYSQLVKANAEMLILGLIDGTIELPGVPPISVQGPSFYPNDQSSAMEPTFEDPSLGPARFSLGRYF